MKLPNYVSMTPLKYSQSKKIALSWKIKDFVLKFEDNEYDPKAIAVLKVDQGIEYHIGYLRKQKYQFTHRANELYTQYQNYLYELSDGDKLVQEHYQDAQSKYFSMEGWGEKEPVSLWTDEELNSIVLNQHKYKLLTNRDMQEWELYLSLK